jgi:hypothetical protein
MARNRRRPEYGADEPPVEDIYLRTVSGRTIHHFCPKPEEFELSDMAHSLSLICRFTGHVPWHYSVAQHSIYVDDILTLLEKQGETVTINDHRWALAHDGIEMVWNDLHTWAKRKLKDYQKAVRHAEPVLLEAFGLQLPEPAIVKKADGILLSTELVQLKACRPHRYPPLDDFIIKRWSPLQAEQRFLRRWYKWTALSEVSATS